LDCAPHFERTLYDNSQLAQVYLHARQVIGNGFFRLSVVREGYHPFQVAALGASNMQPASVPLLQDRGFVHGHAAAYMCRNCACQAPVTTPEALEEPFGLR
jgi:uncharacterized protein YyaL (SSP411 family)